MSGLRIGTAAPPTLEAQHAQLRKAARQLEGVFMSQLFQAMRSTESQDPTITGGQAGEMFQSMLDDQIAEKAALRTDAGIGEALYRQLSRHLAPLPLGGTPAPKGE